MDTYELNKIAGAILATVLLIFGVKEVAGIIYSGHTPETLAYSIDAPEDGGDQSATTDEPAETMSVAMLMSTADADKGLKGMKKCAACHTWENGGANKIGPNLYGIMGRQMASTPGFAYSPAMTEKAQEVGTWSFEAMNEFLKSPKKYVKGTKMAFAGLKDNQRADVIMFLRNQADTPMALPEE